MQPILDVRNLNKTYAGGFEALKDVSLEIERGEIFGLLGPNGAGKTTTLRMLYSLLPPDAGEILIDGPAVSPGYVGESPRVGPHRSGDLGHLDEKGRLVVTGRKDGAIITGGENVSPDAVEAAIESTAGAGQAVVFGVPDDEWGQIVVAVVEASENDLPRIAVDVRSLVAKHEVPRRWIAVDVLPLLSNGKPDRSAARALGETEG